MDASFGVHEDFKLQSGGLLTLSLAGGAIISSSSKQKLNTPSSTEAELVAVDDFIGKLLWTQRFLGEQGYNLQKIYCTKIIKMPYFSKLRGGLHWEKGQGHYY